MPEGATVMCSNNPTQKHWECPAIILVEEGRGFFVQKTNACAVARAERRGPYSKKTPTFIKAKLISGHKSCVVMKVELLKRKMRISQAWEHHASCVKWWGYFSELQKIKNIRKCWRDTLRHQPGNVNWGKGRPSDWTTTVSMTSKGLFYKSHHKHLRWIVMVNFWFELYLATQNPCFNEPHLLLKHVIFFSPSFVNVSDDWCEIWMFVTAFTFLCSGCGPGGGEIGGGSALSEGAAPRSSWSEVLLLL